MWHGEGPRMQRPAAAYGRSGLRPVGWNTGGRRDLPSRADRTEGAMGAVPGIWKSRGLHAGGLLLLSCSDVSHSMLTAR